MPVFFLCVAIYLCIVFFLTVFVYRVTVADPTDKTVYKERFAFEIDDQEQIKVFYDPKKYSLYCDVCETHVTENAKHCRVCNRCTSEFDHHCIWVSNDIGDENYIDFLRMLYSLIAFLVL